MMLMTPFTALAPQRVAPGPRMTSMAAAACESRSGDFFTEVISMFINSSMFKAANPADAEALVSAARNSAGALAAAITPRARAARDRAVLKREPRGAERFVPAA